MIANRAIDLKLLAKSVMLATRWPRFVESLIDDDSFLGRLSDLWKGQRDLEAAKVSPRPHTSPEAIRTLQTKLDVLRADRRIAARVTILT
jgi:hypothetical protein